jgi:hypothetical protein
MKYIAVLFQPSTFFTEQLTAFEVWLDHGSEHKKPPEQLPIVLQVHHTVLVFVTFGTIVPVSNTLVMVVTVH